MTVLMVSLGLIPFMASRSMVVIFSTALFARFAPGWEWAAPLIGIELTAGLPHWMTQDEALFILGIAALLEAWIAAQSQSARDLGQFAGPALRAGTAIWLSYAVLHAQPDQVAAIIKTADGPIQAGLLADGLSAAWSVGIGGMTWYVANLRASIYAFLDEMDPDDDLRMKSLLGWLESFVVFWGGLYVLVLPFLALITAGLTVAALQALRWWINRREKQQMVPCHHCTTPRHLCATWCYACGQHPHPIYQVGFLGRITRRPIQTWRDHQFAMTTRKRCYYCGTRFNERRIGQNCPQCRQPVFADHAQLDNYLAAIDRRLWPTMGMTALFGLVPVLGVIPGVIYYRLRLTAPLRVYMPFTVGCFTRWCVRLLSLFLIALQPFALGWATLPLLAWVNYSVTRAVFRMEAHRSLGKAFQPQPLRST